MATLIDEQTKVLSTLPWSGITSSGAVAAGDVFLFAVLIDTFDVEDATSDLYFSTTPGEPFTLLSDLFELHAGYGEGQVLLYAKVATADDVPGDQLLGGYTKFHTNTTAFQLTQWSGAPALPSFAEVLGDEDGGGGGSVTTPAGVTAADAYLYLTVARSFGGLPTLTGPGLDGGSSDTYSSPGDFLYVKGVGRTSATDNGAQVWTEDADGRAFTARWAVNFGTVAITSDSHSSAVIPLRVTVKSLPYEVHSAMLGSPIIDRSRRG